MSNKRSDDTKKLLSAFHVVCMRDGVLGDFKFANYNHHDPLLESDRKKILQAVENHFRHHEITIDGEGEIAVAAALLKLAAEINASKSGRLESAPPKQVKSPPPASLAQSLTDREFSKEEINRLFLGEKPKKGNPHSAHEAVDDPEELNYELGDLDTDDLDSDELEMDVAENTDGDLVEDNQLPEGAVSAPSSPSASSETTQDPSLSHTKSRAGDYTPSPEEITAATKEIQREWSKVEREKRTIQAFRKIPWQVPGSKRESEPSR